MIVTFMCERKSLCRLHCTDTHKRSVHVVALPNETQQAGFWVWKSVWTSSLCFLYTCNTQKLFPVRCMSCCTGYRATGRTQTLKKSPYTLQMNSLNDANPPCTSMYPWFSDSLPALCMRSSNICFFCLFDLMLFTWISCIKIKTLLLVWGTTKSQWR